MFSLFAQQARPAGSPFDRPELIWGSVGLAGALIVGGLVILVVDRWRRRSAMADPQAGLELSDFRAMFESGQISKDEYEKLRLKVADRVKKPEVAPAAPEAPATGQPATPPPVAGPYPPGYIDDPNTQKPPE